jgi:hypothetical protein
MIIRATKAISAAVAGVAVPRCAEGAKTSGVCIRPTVVVYEAFAFTGKKRVPTCPHAHQLVYIITIRTNIKSILPFVNTINHPFVNTSKLQVL